MSKSKGEVKIEQQEAQGRALASAHDIEVTEIYVDDGVSAYVFADRPGWAQMMADVQAGRLDVLIAQAEDRFTRQPMEKETLAALCAGSGVTWLTVNDGALDPATADGAFFSTLRAGLARMESQRKSERQRQSNDHHAERGGAQRGGVRPFGYEDDKVTVRESEAKLVREAYASFIAGGTVSGIATRWNADNVLTTRGSRWDINKVGKILRRERNAGLVRHRGAILRDERGEAIRGEWDPLVDETTYLAAVARLDSVPRHGGRLHAPKYLLSGIAKCGACGLVVRSFKDGQRVERYRCTVHDGQGHKEKGVRHVSIRVEDIEPTIRDAMVAAVMFAPSDALSDRDTAEVATLNVRRGEVARALARLVELVEEEVFTLAEIAAKKRKLSTEADDIDARIADITQRSARAAILAETSADLWADSSLTTMADKRAAIRARFDGLPLEQRRTLVRSLLDITIEKGRGAGRVRVTHLVATTLNSEADPYVEEQPEAV
ncbi:MAG: hypothetical protein CMH83_06680 [Nocardioides sp.]|nr:hypothetical protein [Nocardioides sp.]